MERVCRDCGHADTLELSVSVNQKEVGSLLVTVPAGCRLERGPWPELVVDSSSDHEALRRAGAGVAAGVCAFVAWAARVGSEPVPADGSDSAARFALLELD